MEWLRAGSGGSTLEMVSFTASGGGGGVLGAAELATTTHTHTHRAMEHTRSHAYTLMTRPTSHGSHKH